MKYFILVMSQIVVSTSLAIPIAFKCNDKKNLTDIVFPDALLIKQDQFARKIKTNNTEADFCDHNCSKKCEIDFSTSEIVESTLQKLLNSNEEPVQAIDIDIFKSYQNFQADKKSQAICQGKTHLDSEGFINEGMLSTFYPYQNNWMFLSGCKSMSLKTCESVFWPLMKNKIKEAVSMGIDPYAFLAKGFLENGISGAASLYLDPVAAMDSIGCRGTPASTSSEKTLSSFGTYYEYKEQVVSSQTLSKRLNSFLTGKGVETQPIVSYVCRDILSSEAKVSKTPMGNHCCMKLPFSSEKETEFLPAIENALVLEQSRKTLLTKFRSEKDPAFRIQRFNGFTNLMGAAEEVPAFRAGIDFFKDPAYGYQGLDFILNSLMINPAIQKEVAAAEKLYGAYSSILCMDQPAGTYAIDSDKYFDLHRNSKRMEVILEKVNAEKLDQITEREKKVLQIEFKSEAVRSKLFPDNSIRNESRVTSLESQLNQIGFKTEFSVNTNIDEIIQTIESQSSKKIPENLKIELLPLFSQLLELSTEQYKFKEVENMHQLLYTLYLLDPKLNEMSFGADDLKSEKLKEIIKNPKFEKVKSIYPQEWENLVYMSKIDQKQSILSSIYNTLMANEISAGYVEANYQITDIKKMESDLNNLKILNENPEAKKFFDEYKTEYSKASFITIDNEMIKKYFKEIYPSRNTTSKASTFSWKKLTDEELEKIASHLKVRRAQLMEKLKKLQ